MLAGLVPSGGREGGCVLVLLGLYMALTCPSPTSSGWIGWAVWVRDILAMSPGLFLFLLYSCSGYFWTPTGQSLLAGSRHSWVRPGPGTQFAHSVCGGEALISGAGTRPALQLPVLAFSYGKPSLNWELGGFLPSSKVPCTCLSHSEY